MEVQELIDKYNELKDKLSPAEQQMAEELIEKLTQGDGKVGMLLRPVFSMVEGFLAKHQ